MNAQQEVTTERALVATCVALGARSVRGWSAVEESLATKSSQQPPPEIVAAIRASIEKGEDPLGVAFCRLRNAEVRRSSGATYTPSSIVASMVRWATATRSHAIERVVDPGVGSARFLLAAARAFPKASLVGVDTDPLATMMARANLAVAGEGTRARVALADYRDFGIERIRGKTLYLGNPPYVRHHLIGERWKTWLTESAAALSYPASQLAGLHVHFFLATALGASPGDMGVFVTSAEWLDVNYGRLVRDLLLGELGARTIQVVEPRAEAFADAASTAAIVGFQVGSRAKKIRLGRVEGVGQLAGLEAGRLVRRERLEMAQRWTPLTRPKKKGPSGYIELGELCRVHRGQVTGANRVWIAGGHSHDLPASVLRPTVTKAKELIGAGSVLANSQCLKNVIDLPADLDELAADDRKSVESFLSVAKAMGANRGFVAEHRKAWWSVGLREPAPILATYMARRAPAFVRNQADARHINIAHGLYPREQMDEISLRGLVAYLATGTSVQDGRTYSGGLTKFEPREMERLLVPPLASLRTDSASGTP